MVQDLELTAATGFLDRTSRIAVGSARYARALALATVLGTYRISRLDSRGAVAGISRKIKDEELRERTILIWERYGEVINGFEELLGAYLTFTDFPPPHYAHQNRPVPESPFYQIRDSSSTSISSPQPSRGRLLKFERHTK